MSSFNKVVSAATAALTLAACTPGREAAPREAYSSVSPSPSPTDELPPAPAFVPNATDIRLLDTNAGINLIYLRPEKLVADGVQPSVDVAYTRQEILTADPTFLQGIRNGFAKATYNRYVPSRVSVTLGGKVALTACLRGTTDELRTIRAAAQPYDKTGSLNVDVVYQSACYNSLLPVAGFESAGGDPVVDESGFSDFIPVILHETGHEGGLDHAGIAVCRNVVAATGCELQATQDPTSVMSYTSTKAVYTYPELGMLGLLRDSEVLQAPKTGDYTLHDINHPGVKVIELKNDAGQPVYLSWEPDDQAVSDDYCQAITSHTDLNNPSISSEGSNYTGGKEVDYVCYTVHVRPLTHSLQVRMPETSTGDTAQNFLADITRPDRAPNKIQTTYETGEVTPGTVVYEGGGYKVILKSVALESSVVSITNIP